MRKPAIAVIVCLVATGALLGGLFGSDAQATVDKYSNFLRRYTTILRIVEKEYVKEVEPQRLVHASIRGMLRTLDPHSSFLARRQYTQLQERQKGSYYGLGITVQMIDGDLTVVSPFEGTPSYRLGIRAGDIISKIESEDTRGMDLDECVKRLRGAKGSAVTISITRVGYELPLDFTIVRDEIKLLSVPYAFVLPDGSGYLRISDFTETTETELHENLKRLEKEGVKRLILDLRDNPGGLLDQAVSVSNTFLRKDSKIVSTKGRTPGSDQDYLAARQATFGDLPVVILVNRGSASASEIVAGAIQDHDRGLIVGETTFGKGLVQSIYRISGGNGLALTTAKYFTPSGRSIQRDYSGSIDDYYYAARTGDSTEAQQGELRHTSAGREVYGGGGISPDIQVTYPRLPKPILTLSSYNVFFDYSALYESKNGRTQNLEGAGTVPEEIRTARSEDVRLIDENFEVDDEVLKHFFGFLERKEVPFEKEALLEHRDRLALLMKAEIFSSIWGAEARQQVLLDNDPQVRAALEALPDAVDLLKDPKAYVSKMAARDKGNP